MLRALAVRMTRDLVPAPEVPRPERFSLRAFTDPMLPGLVALHNRTNESSPWTEDEVRERLAAGTHGLFLGVDQRGPVGFSWVTTSGTEAEVAAYGIDEHALGTGLAAALIARGLQWAEVRGAYTAVAHIHEEDARSARILRRLGFMTEPERSA